MGHQDEVEESTTTSAKAPRDQKRERINLQIMYRLCPIEEIDKEVEERVQLELEASANEQLFQTKTKSI